MSGDTPLWDVAIVGGGPAGTAAALTLRRHAPALRVCLLEASDYQHYRPGEVIAPTARAVLAQLGVLPAVEAAAFLLAPATLAAWDTARPVERHGMFSARGGGWIVDRQRFDRLLASDAAARGAAVCLNCSVLQLSGAEDAWRLQCSDNAVRTSRFLILATGRRWNLARSLGARLTTSDRLAGDVRIMRDETRSYGGLVVEAAAHGWWYTAPMPDRRRVIVRMSDADLVERRANGSWRQSLAETLLVRQCAPEAGVELHAGSYSAATTRLGPAAAAGWVAAGDAAIAFDPLSAQGVAKALRAGVFAAYAASDALAGRAGASRRYAAFVAREWQAHESARSEVYGRVQRWPDALFWQRRQLLAGVPA